MTNTSEDNILPNSLGVWTNGTWAYNSLRGTVPEGKGGWHNIELDYNDTGLNYAKIDGNKIISDFQRDEKKKGGWPVLISGFEKSEFTWLAIDTEKDKSERIIQ